LKRAAKEWRPSDLITQFRMFLAVPGGLCVKSRDSVTRIATLAMLSVLSVAAAQPDARGLDLLARRLANPDTRREAVEEVVASSATLTPVLLAWTTNPPHGVEVHELDVGLVEAFDWMKTEAAVPFLVRVIGIKRAPYTLAPWNKGVSNVEFEYRAAEALIRIGPPAAREVIKAAQGRMTPIERLLAIFVVSQAGNVPGAREFLRAAVGQANDERIWAEKGLEALKEKEEKGTGTPK
jgi:hypothetical protein